MYSEESLAYAVKGLYHAGVLEGDYREDEIDALLDRLDFHALAQVIRHKAQTVHTYLTQGPVSKSFNYRGADLFCQPATQLLTVFDQGISEVARTTRTVELWLLLEDMAFIAVPCISVRYESNSGPYITEYREAKGNPWEYGMELDLEALTDTLEALCSPYYEYETPIYEL